MGDWGLVDWGHLRLVSQMCAMAASPAIHIAGMCDGGWMPPRTRNCLARWDAEGDRRGNEFPASGHESRLKPTDCLIRGVGWSWEWRGRETIAERGGVHTNYTV